MKLPLLICGFMLLSMCLVAQQTQQVLEEKTVKLPACKSFRMPQDCVNEDANYTELVENDASISKAIFTIINGERTGELMLFDASESLIAKATYDNGKLNALNMLINGTWLTKKIKYDAPFWFFRKNTIRATGKVEQENEHKFIWLAGQRYRME